MLWFKRKTLSGSQRRFRARSRASFASPYAVSAAEAASASPVPEPRKFTYSPTQYVARVLPQTDASEKLLTLLSTSNTAPREEDSEEISTTYPRIVHPHRLCLRLRFE